MQIKCSNRFLEERTFIEVVVENKILRSKSCLTCFVDSMHLSEYRNPTEDEVPRHPTEVGQVSSTQIYYLLPLSLSPPLCIADLFIHFVLTLLDGWDWMDRADRFSSGNSERRISFVLIRII
jgi:hypothetical protein